MRGAARGLIAALALCALAPAAGAAPPVAPFFPEVRGLDGGQFLEDEPVWVCDARTSTPGDASGRFLVHDFVLAGVEDGGRVVPSPAVASKIAAQGARAGEFVQSLAPFPRRDLHPLGPWTSGGLKAGRYEIRTAGDQRVVARFRVLPPRASELAVRSALARAARLALMDAAAGQANAARLYESVLARYPRTSYRSAIYAGLWRVRAHTAYAGRESAWLEEVFAHFHDTCFGTWALDVFMRDVPAEVARPRLKKLVGLYPDTPLSRAAARYL